MESKLISELFQEKCDIYDFLYMLEDFMQIIHNENKKKFDEIYNNKIDEIFESQNLKTRKNFG